MADHWSREELEATVADYLDMLTRELAGVAYSKAEHAGVLAKKLRGRSRGAIEYKHANVSAALIHLGHPYITGYQPRFNYQRLLLEVAAGQLARSPTLLKLAAQRADDEIVPPEIDNILSIQTDPPKTGMPPDGVGDSGGVRPAFAVDYLEREARNRSLGAAGEIFIIRYERTRLIQAGKEMLADRIEYTARERGDAMGYDIMSFDTSGRERLIEVKTTKYGAATPFFLSRNEVEVSDTEAERYHLYRLFLFQRSPQLFILDGRVAHTCRLSAASFMATPA